MFRALLSMLRSSALVELVGAGLIVGGVYVQTGGGGALIAGGSALVLKAFELDARGNQ